MLVALTVILSFFTIYITQSARFSFSFVPMAMGGMLFGPVVSSIIGVLSDIIGYIIKPTGPYMPLFTLNALITGMMYGIFLFKKKPTLKNIVTAQIIVTILVDITLNSCWLFFPVQVLILYLIAKYLPAIRDRFNYNSF